MIPDGGCGWQPLQTPYVLPLMLPPPSTLLPQHKSPRYSMHPHPCPTLHLLPSIKSPRIGLAVASVTHLLPATNWSDAAEVVAVSALQSCLSLLRQLGKEGHREERRRESYCGAGKSACGFRHR